MQCRKCRQELSDHVLICERCGAGQIPAQEETEGEESRGTAAEESLPQPAETRPAEGGTEEVVLRAPAAEENGSEQDGGSEAEERMSAAADRPRLLDAQDTRMDRPGRHTGPKAPVEPLPRADLPAPEKGTGLLAGPVLWRLAVIAAELGAVAFLCARLFF